MFEQYTCDRCYASGVILNSPTTGCLPDMKLGKKCDSCLMESEQGSVFKWAAIMPEIGRMVWADNLFCLACDQDLVLDSFFYA